jgi:tetratricopeptide (TPR) repeat protein
VELMPRAGAWLDELDRHLEAGDNPVLAHQILPPFFDAIGFPDAQARKDRLARRSVQILMSHGRYSAALLILQHLPGANPRLIAECYEQTGQLAKAAEIYLEQGERDKALKCYRSAPDFASALNLVRQMENHAAKPSLEWLAELEAVLARRPDNFSRVMTPPEKKLLESLLERGLGVQRKKAPAKKADAKKAGAKSAEKTTPRKKRTNPPRQPARD